MGQVMLCWYRYTGSAKRSAVGGSPITPHRDDGLGVELGVQQVEEGLHHPRHALQRTQDRYHVEQLVRLEQGAYAREGRDEDETFRSEAFFRQTTGEAGTDTRAERLTHDGDARGRDLLGEGEVVPDGAGVDEQAGLGGGAG